MKTHFFAWAAVGALSWFADPPTASAAITNVSETNLGAEDAAQIGNGFGEDVLSMSDRAHQHNGAAFNSGTNLLSNTGDLIVPLPDYLLGHDYVRFANDARALADYSATVTADSATVYYLLVDNRVNGPAGTNGSPNTDDPALGGTLQWVIDAGWERVNTGISPNGQADYTAVDEGGDSVGAGIGLNQFYAVYKFPVLTAHVVVRNNGMTDTNMVAVVAEPAVAPPEAIVSFLAQPNDLPPGESTLLTWLIDPTASTASIDQGIGNILPGTSAAGAGSMSVTPEVDTTYTLSVTSPNGTEAAPVTVTVQPLAYFRADNTFVDAGDPVTLSWRVRTDATVSISGIGDVGPQTDADGIGSLIVEPTESTTYTITATAGGREEQFSVLIGVNPAGPTYALIDIGATGGQVEPGAVGGVEHGAGPNNTNGAALAEVTLTSDTGDDFTIAIDNLDPSGAAVGALDWRDRGNAPATPLAFLAEDFVKNNEGMIHVTLGSLPAGTYNVISYHLDPTNSQCPNIRILVTDANGVAVDTNARGDASFATIPQVAGLTTGLVDSKGARFQVTSNGVDLVMIYFDGVADPVDDEVPFNGLWITQAPVEAFEAVGVSRTVAGGTASATIEFTSTPGQIYSVWTSPDLVAWTELNDNVPASAGDTTTFTESNIPLDVIERYYRVQRN